MKQAPPQKIERWFSEKLTGVVWKTQVDHTTHRLFIECRDQDAKRALFSALDLNTRRWLWKDVTFEEPWWIGLSGCTSELLFLSVYDGQHGPARSHLAAVDATTADLRWWRNNFSLIGIFSNAVKGTDTSTQREIVLALVNGGELAQDSFVGEPQNLMTIRPFQYQRGTGYFETVRRFLETRCNFSGIVALEYVEFGSFFIISAFIGENDLANYLLICDKEGQVVARETLGEHLKGITTDTFFLFPSYLIFVKNRSELVSYRFL